MVKRNVFLIASVSVIPACYVFGMAEPPVREGKPLVCVGVFDSRAVALAWARGGEFQKQIEDMKAEREKAKASGDTKRVNELEKEGPALQERMHRQVFGNEPIDAVLKKIEKDLPKIASLAGVDMIISKWEIAYQKQSAKYEDVTWAMANLFEPDDKTKKIIEDLLTQKPIPSEELEKSEH